MQEQQTRSWFYEEWNRDEAIEFVRANSWSLSFETLNEIATLIEEDRSIQLKQVGEE